MGERDGGYRAPVVERGRSDGALVAAIRAGDRGAFGEVYDRHGPRIEAFCARILGDPHLGADAAQDTFVVAARRLDQLRDPEALRAWLYAIARNESTRVGRARGRLVPTEDAAMSAGLDEPAGADRTGDAAVAADHAALVWAAADGLADADRVLLELSLRHGLEGSELAAAAGVAPGQVSMATGRLRDRLERSIGALLVARGARDDCPALAVTLADWDGTYSVLVRKRVARHIERCDHCSERRRTLVAPLGTLALAPLALPLAFPPSSPDRRARVLEAADRALGPAGPSAAGGPGVETHASSHASTEPTWPDGFPPVPDGWWDDHEAESDPEPDPEPPAAGRRRLVAALALVALLAIAGLAAWIGADDGDAAAPADAVAAGSSAGDPRSGPGTSAPRDLGAPTSTGGPTTSTGGSTTTSVPTSTTTRPGDEVPSSLPGTPPPPTTAPAPPVTLAPPPTAAPNIAPTVGPPTSSGDASMQTGCNPADDTRTITVAVADDRGVVDVVLRWDHSASGPGEVAMTRVGAATWRATLGPFADAGTVSYRAVATDTDGATGASPAGSITVDPCPG
jgi:RNA polymerase sigma factor (sigma-70 family)